MLTGFDERLINQLIFEEGMRLKAYKDTKGLITIGIGHNLVDEPIFKGSPIGTTITEDLAYELLAHDLSETYKGLDKGWPWFSKMPSGARQDAIVAAAFQLGVGSLLRFKNMLRFIEHGQYENAAIAGLNSKWAKKDTPARAKRVMGQLRLSIYYPVPVT
jgi:lysozyme